MRAQVANERSGSTTPEDDPHGLLSVSQASYGESYHEHLLEQYKLYVEMADRVSGRRATANTFFLTANSVLLAAVGALYRSSPTDSLQPVSALAVAICGVILCIVWRLMIGSYRQLNTAKWSVVGEMESLLPIAPYAAEWRSVEGGKNYRKYLQLTVVEAVATWAFAGFYVILVAAVLAF